MDSHVSWNTQPECDNPTFVLLVGRIGAFTARIGDEVIEVGDRLIGHVMMGIVGWRCRVWMGLMKGLSANGQSLYP